ncbi:MAG: hypothetical protein KDA21_01090 [Phycisphaerales bacterium]|nr:hypothetical protein [Phycisphaerales bacterium]
MKTSAGRPLPGRRLWLFAGCITTVAAASASAEDVLIDFQDLAPPASFLAVPDLYHGLSWASSDWFYGELGSDPGQIYVALGSSNAAIYGINGDDFFFDGADYWSRRTADANGDFYYVLYHDGQQVYDGRNESDGRQRFDGAPQHLAPNYAGPVDIVALAFDGGGDDWDHLAMDNLLIRTIGVPPICLADVDQSGAVDFADLNLVLSGWGRQIGETGFTPEADLDADGLIGFNDLNIVLGDWGCTVPAR